MTEKAQYKAKSHSQILHEVYQKAQAIFNDGVLAELLTKLDKSEEKNLQIIIDNCEKGRGVLTVLITSLVHKLHNPVQDIRLHQENMKGGYSGRVIDTKYITPFMKGMGFPAMAESGWLTRSLEQNLPYDLKYPGKITPSELKAAFLYLLDQIQTHGKFPEIYLLFLFTKLIEHRERITIDLAKPTNLPISVIIEYLREHFESRYSSRGASRLPVLAIYAIYQCLMRELRRFDGKVLMPLEEHTSSDKGSGRVGDIEVRDRGGRVFEAVEIKHGMPINSKMVRDAYEKFKSQPLERYYLLSTVEEYLSNPEDITREVSRILKIHGSQVIVNGIYPSLKYYLRLLHNSHDFIENYVELLKKDRAIKYEHKQRWNELVGRGASR